MKIFNQISDQTILLWIFRNPTKSWSNIFNIPGNINRARIVWNCWSWKRKKLYISWNPVWLQKFVGWSSIYFQCKFGETIFEKCSFFQISRNYSDSPLTDLENGFKLITRHQKRRYIDVRKFLWILKCYSFNN